MALTSVKSFPSCQLSERTYDYMMFVVSERHVALRLKVEAVDDSRRINFLIQPSGQTIKQASKNVLLKG